MPVPEETAVEVIETVEPASTERVSEDFTRFSDSSSTKEDGTVGETGLTPDELEEIGKDLRDDSIPKTAEVEHPKTEEKEATTLSETDEKAAEVKTEKTATETKEGKEEVTAKSEDGVPEGAVDKAFKEPLVIEYVANGHKKTRTIKSVADIQRLASKADGLAVTAQEARESENKVRDDFNVMRERNAKVVKEFRTRELADEQIKPFLDVVRNDPGFRQRMMTDQAVGPRLKAAGVTVEAVRYDHSAKLKEIEISDREEALREKEFGAEFRDIAIKFAEENGVPFETMPTVFQYCSTNDLGDHKINPDGSYAPIEEQRKHWNFNLKKALGLMALEGKYKPSHAKASEDRAAKMKQQIEQMKNMQRDKRSAPGGGIKIPVGQKEVTRRDGESDQAFNRRLLDETPGLEDQIRRDLRS